MPYGLIVASFQFKGIMQNLNYFKKWGPAISVNDLK